MINLTMTQKALILTTAKTERVLADLRGESAKVAEITMLIRFLDGIDFCAYCGEAADMGHHGVNIETLVQQDWCPRFGGKEDEGGLICPACFKAGKVVQCDECGIDAAKDSSDVKMAWSHSGGEHWLCPACHEEDDALYCECCSRKVKDDADAGTFTSREGPDGKAGPMCCPECSAVRIALDGNVVYLTGTDLEPVDMAKIARLEPGDDVSLNYGAHGVFHIVRLKSK